MARRRKWRRRSRSLEWLGTWWSGACPEVLPVTIVYGVTNGLAHRNMPRNLSVIQPIENDIGFLGTKERRNS